MLSFFPRDVLDEIGDLIESVSDGFPTYSFMKANTIVVLEKWLGAFISAGVFISTCINTVPYFIGYKTFFFFLPKQSQRSRSVL